MVAITSWTDAIIVAGTETISNATTMAVRMSRLGLI